MIQAPPGLPNFAGKHTEEMSKLVIDVLRISHDLHHFAPKALAIALAHPGQGHASGAVGHPKLCAHSDDTCPGMISHQKTLQAIKESLSTLEAELLPQPGEHRVE